MKKLIYIMLGAILSISFGFTTEIESWKTHYSSGNDIWIKVKDKPNNLEDWVGIYLIKASNNWDNVVTWRWAKNTSEANDPGDWYKFALEDGNYEARFFLNNTFNTEDSVPFHVGDVTRVDTQKSVYGVNETLHLNVVHISGDRDWVGIYPKGTNNDWGNVVQWSWVNHNGNLDINGIPSGNYEARLFFYNSFDVESKVAFRVGTTLKTSKATYNPSDIVHVTLDADNLSGDQDWVGVFPKDTDNRWSNVVAWNWVADHDTFDLSTKNKPMLAGEYEVRLFWHNEYGADVVAKQIFGFNVSEGGLYTYPPETLFNKLVVDLVDRPAHKFDSYVDSAFDNKVQRIVTRMTDREKDNKGFNSHPYPKQGTAWNSDMTLLRLAGRIFDAQTLEEIPLTRGILGGEVFNLMKTPESGSSGIRWSKHNPNVLYVMSDKKKFYKLTINEDRTALEEELIIDLSDMPYPFFNIGQDEGNIDYADRYVVLTSIINDDVYATLLDIQSKQLVWGPRKLDIPKDRFDWISVSPSGNYILINEFKEATDSKMHLYNRNLEKIRTLANSSQHGDICYDQNGNEMYVQLRYAGGGIFGYVLNNRTQYQEPIKLLDSNYGGGHVSCRNYKRKGWAYVSTKQDGYRDVFALKLDGSKKVQRFAKTHTGGYSMAVPSPDGTRVLFMSNFSNPNYKYDTYQVRISQ